MSEVDQKQMKAGDKLEPKMHYFLYINGVSTEVSKKDWEKSWKDYYDRVRIKTEKEIM